MRTIGLIIEEEPKTPIIEEEPKTPKAPVKKAKKPTPKKEEEPKPDTDAE